MMNLDSEVDLDGFDGRALSEAFAAGPDEEQVPIQVQTNFVESNEGDYRAAVQLTELDQHRYVDKSWCTR